MNNMNTGTFLDGNILIPVTMLQLWLKTVNFLTPMTSGGLNEQFSDCATEMNVLLASVPQPQINASKMIIPFLLVNELKFAFATYIYQSGPFNSQDFIDTEDNIASVFDCYSITYWNSAPGTLVIY